MPKIYLKHQIQPTALAQKIFRARISLRETQSEFSNRFRTTVSTINNWETGKTKFIQRIHLAILDSIEQRLKHEGRWLPEDLFIIAWKLKLERKNYV